jgi:hypothetical protein
MAGGTGIAAGGEDAGRLRRGPAGLPFVARAVLLPAVASDEPDPGADPVSCALSQMAPLGQLHASGSKLCWGVAA